MMRSRVIKAAGGAALAAGAGAIGYPLLFRRWCLAWGATDEEVSRKLPGDELVPEADIVSTRAVTIEAPPGAVWPWLVQMGSGRGGAYTYDWIENLLGLHMHSARQILPQFQDLKVGDELPLGPGRPVMRVEVCDPERTLAIRFADGNWVWIFALVAEDGRTRLISRNRIATPGAARPVRLFNLLVMEPGSLVMERKMLLGIKQRAEAVVAERHLRGHRPCGCARCPCYPRAGCADQREDHMARSLLVAPAAENVNLARTCLGLLRALDRRGVNVAFVKPVAQLRADGGPDRSAALVTAISALRPPEPMTTAELEQQLGEGELDVVLDKIVAAWEPIYERSDVVVVEGLRVRTLGAVRQLAEPGAGPGAGCRRSAGRRLARGWRRRGPGRATRHRGGRIRFRRAGAGRGLRGPRPARGRCRRGRRPRQIRHRGRRVAGRPGQAQAPPDRRGAAPPRADLAAGP